MGRKPQSKLMSRRTERPYKVDGTDKLAQHSKVPCSVPEINGPVAQQEFTSLLREFCACGTAATPGTPIREDRWASTEVSRSHSTGRYEPGNTPGGLTTREGLNLAGRHDHRWSCPGALKPTGRATGQRPPWQRKSAASSVRTARNRRTRTRMSGGVGGGGINPPADPIGH